MKKHGFKSTMKKAFASLLVALMLVPTLASCSGDSEIEDTVIPVYTFYGIKGEGTTDDAIRSVELAINRILISRYTLAIDFRLFSEEEYEEALNLAIAEVENYEESEDSSVESEDDEDYEYTEDKIIETLEKGEDFKFKAPRVDIVLCKDVNQYTYLANAKKLADLNTTLENEAKVLSEYIHPTIMTLAKIGKKTYAVPNNVALGEYEYIVFNKKYLEENKYDYSTMKTFEDLEDYLKLIKENHPDVLPLKEAGSPAGYEYMFGENSPFFLEPFTTDAGENTAKIHGTFDTELFTPLIDDYATLIAKYRSAGYLTDDPSKFEDFAVTFIKGTPLDIEALKAETGNDYEYSIYKNPVATRDSLNALYGISSTVTDTELTTIVDIIVSIFTDEQIKNYFYYGIQGEHYIVDDYGFIEPIKNGETDAFEYNMKNEYTGNIYLAKIKQGENINVYNYMKDLNISTSLSLTSGFSYSPKIYTANGETITEPDYIEVMKTALGDANANLANGSYGIIDYDKFASELEETVKESALVDVKEKFATQLEEAYMAKMAEYFKSDEYFADLDVRVREIIHNNLVTNATTALQNQIKSELEAQYKEEAIASNPDASESEISEIVLKKLEEAYAERITETEINAYISANFSDADIENLVKNRKNVVTDSDKKDTLKEYTSSQEYIKAVTAYENSEQYKADVEAYIATSGIGLVDNRYTIAVNDAILTKAAELQEKAIAAVNEAIDKFNKEACDLFGWSEDEMYENLDIFTYADFVDNRITKVYYTEYVDPNAATA